MPNNLITSLTTEILYMFNKMTRLWQSVCGNRRSLRNPETLLSWGFPGTAGAACFLWESNWGRGEDIAEALVDRLEFSDSELSLLLPWVSKPANQKGLLNYSYKNCPAPRGSPSLNWDHLSSQWVGKITFLRHNSMKKNPSFLCHKSTEINIIFLNWWSNFQKNRYHLPINLIFPLTKFY